MQARRSLALPVLALVFNAFVWGVSWWPMRLLRDWGVHPLWATVLTYLVAVAAVLLWRPRTVRVFLEHRALWWLVASSGLTNACFNWAVSMGDVVRVVLLFYLMPVWAVLLAWWVFKEKPPVSALLRIALALVGVVLVLQPAGSQWHSLVLPVPRTQADVLAILGGFFFACTNVLLTRMGHIPALAKLLAMFGGGTVCSGAVGLVALALGVGGVTALPPVAWPWVLAIVLFSLVLMGCNACLQYGAARISAHSMSLLMTLEVVFAAVSSVWLGSAELSSRVLLGGTLVLAASVLAALGHRQGQQALAQCQ